MGHLRSAHKIRAVVQLVGYSRITSIKELRRDLIFDKKRQIHRRRSLSPQGPPASVESTELGAMEPLYQDLLIILHRIRRLSLLFLPALWPL